MPKTHPRHHPTGARRPASLTGLPLMIFLWLLVAAVPLIPAWRLWSRQMQAEGVLSHHRAVVNELVQLLRASHAKAIAERQSYEVRFDAKQQVIYLFKLPRNQKAYAALERTVWFPQGLVLAESPSRVAMQANGAMTPASIIILNSVNRRAFQIKTYPNGIVELHEEPTL